MVKATMLGKDSELRRAVVVFVIGLICFGLALFSRVQHKSALPNVIPSTADSAIAIERKQAIEQALKAGKHDYEFTVTHAPPPISP